MSDLEHFPKPDTATDKLSQRRRALIKGSAIAIPAILTLRSGSALAMNESASCALKIQQNPPTNRPDVVLVGSDDNWYRKTTECRTLSLKSSPTTTLQVFRQPGGDNWYNVNSNTASGNPFVDTVGVTNEMNNNGVAYTYTSTSSCAVLVQVDEHGNETGVTGAASSGFPFASDSCYSSLHP